MLTLVEVVNASSNTLQLPLADSSAGYEVQDIEGLDPVKATLTSSTMPQIDGAQPQNAQRGTRNITMTLGLSPDYVTNTVDSLRSDLYDYFMPEANILLRFYKDDVLTVVTQGQVESCENSMFSADPAVDISIICYDPDFYAPDEDSISGNTVTDTTIETITYEGSSDTGVIFTLNIDRSLSGFTLYNTRPDGTLQKFDVEGSFDLDDVVTITSISGAKSIVLNRDSLTTSPLYFVSQPVNWITLAKGDNQFRVVASGAAVPYTITYTPKYGGL